MMYVRAYVDDLACRRRKILGEERKANELNDVSTNTGTLNGEPSNPTPKSERCPGLLAARLRDCDPSTDTVDGWSTLKRLQPSRDAETSCWIWRPRLNCAFSLFWCN
jgi:hypothetical protein